MSIIINIINIVYCMFSK